MQISAHIISRGFLSSLEALDHQFHMVFFRLIVPELQSSLVHADAEVKVRVSEHYVICIICYQMYEVWSSSFFMKSK